MTKKIHNYEQLQSGEWTGDKCDPVHGDMTPIIWRVRVKDAEDAVTCIFSLTHSCCLTRTNMWLLCMCDKRQWLNVISMLLLRRLSHCLPCGCGVHPVQLKNWKIWTGKFDADDIQLCEQKDTCRGILLAQALCLNTSPLPSSLQPAAVLVPVLVRSPTPMTNPHRGHQFFLYLHYPATRTS